MEGEREQPQPGDGWDLCLDDDFSGCVEATTAVAGAAATAADAALPSEALPTAAAEATSRTAGRGELREPHSQPAPAAAASCSAAGAVGDDGWDTDTWEPQPNMSGHTSTNADPSATGASSADRVQSEWTMEDFDFEELACPAKGTPAYSSGQAASSTAQPPPFAALDASGAWLQSVGLCVLAARGSPAYLDGVAALRDASQQAGAPVAFFYEQRLPLESLLVVLPRESRCRWLRLRGSGDCSAPVAEACRLLEQLSGGGVAVDAPEDSSPPPPPLPQLLPLRFEPADFARRAFGSLLASPAAGA